MDAGLTSQKMSSEQDDSSESSSTNETKSNETDNKDNDIWEAGDKNSTTNWLSELNYQIADSIDDRKNPITGIK